MHKRIPTETEAVIVHTFSRIIRPEEDHVVLVVLGLNQQGPTIFAPAVAALGQTLALIDSSMDQTPEALRVRVVSEMVKRGLTDETMPQGPLYAAQHAYYLLRLTMPPETFADIRFVLVFTDDDRGRVIGCADQDEFVQAMATIIDNGQGPGIEIKAKHRFDPPGDGPTKH